MVELGNLSFAHVFHKPHLFLMSGEAQETEGRSTSFSGLLSESQLPFQKMKKTDLVLYNALTNSLQAQVFFDHPIQSVKFTKQLVLVLDEAGGAHVYCAKRFKPLVTLQLGTTQKRNLFLSSTINGEHSLLIQNQDVSGSVQVFDIGSRKFRPKFFVHDSAINKVCVSHDGHFFATCSQKGTTVKLFDLQTGDLVKKFRTQLTKNQIQDLSFSRRSEFLVCVSETRKV